MSLEQIINDDIKKAMLAKDRKSLDALRAVKSAILLLKTEKGGGEITPEVEMATLQKLVKQRKESAELYKSQGRDDLYADEVAQLEVISKYLPEQMSEEEIRKQVQTMMADNGLTTIKDMGRLMGLASKAFAGKADNKVVAAVVKSLLQ